MAVRSALRAYRPLLPGRRLVLISVKSLGRPQGHRAAGRTGSIENSNNHIGNRNRDLPACSTLIHGCIYPCIIYLGTNWRVISLTPRPLYPRGINPWYLQDRRLGEPNSRSGRRGEEKILYSTGTPTHWSLSPQPVVMKTELPRLPEIVQ
jgi:hypothetical protein